MDDGNTGWNPPRASIAVVVALAAAAAAAVATSPASAAIELDGISMAVGKGLVDGVVEIDPYYMDITVTGRNIASVDVTTPASCQIPLMLVRSDSWWNEVDEYASINEIRLDPCVGFGNFTFDIQGTSGDQDSVTVAFDPGDSDLITGYGDVSSPVHNDFSAPQETTYQWSCVGTCGAEGWDLQVVDVAAAGWAHLEFLGPSATSWYPGPLYPQTDYLFWNHSAELVGTGRDNLLTDGGDPFVFEKLFVTLNQITFSTEERIVLDVDKTALSWTALTAAISYDVVRGDAIALHGPGGNLTDSVRECLANDASSTSLSYADDPLTGEAFWIVVRGVSGSGSLTYDTLLSSQNASRDAPIDSGSGTCP